MEEGTTRAGYFLLREGMTYAAAMARRSVPMVLRSSILNRVDSERSLHPSPRVPAAFRSHMCEGTRLASPTESGIGFSSSGIRSTTQ